MIEADHALDCKFAYLASPTVPLPEYSNAACRSLCLVISPMTCPVVLLEANNCGLSAIHGLARCPFSCQSSLVLIFAGDVGLCRVNLIYVSGETAFRHLHAPYVCGVGHDLGCGFVCLYDLHRELSLDLGSCFVSSAAWVLRPSLHRQAPLCHQIEPASSRSLPLAL